MASLKLASVEQHHPPSDDREVMFPLKIVEDRTQGNNIFKEVSQNRDIPLAVAQLVNQAVLGFFERDLKSLVEGAIRGSHAQGGVKNQERLAHRIDDVLGVRFDGLQVRLGAPPFRDIFHSQHQQLPVMARLKLAGVEQHHPPPNGREVMLQLKVVKDRTLGDNIFQEGSQVGNVPLAVAQLVNQAVLGFFDRDFKGLIEGAVT